MAPTPAKALSCIGGSSINTADNSAANGTIKADASEEALSKKTSSGGNSDPARPFADLMTHVAPQLSHGRPNLPAPLGSRPSRTGKGGTDGVLWVIQCADAVLAAGLQNTNPLWTPAINVLNPDLEIDVHSSLETQLDPPGNVPAPLALLGAGAAFGWSRRRLNPAQPFGNLDTRRLLFPGQLPAEPVFCEAGRR